MDLDERIAVLGNCQTKGLTDCFRLMNPSLRVERLPLTATPEQLAPFGTILSQIWLVDPLRPRFPKHAKVVAIPSVYYSAFHPDLVYATYKSKPLLSPLVQYNSSIVLRAWLDEIPLADCIKLFTPDVYEHLGFFQHEAESLAAAKRADASADIAYYDLVREWRKTGCFMFSVNHPKITAIESLAEVILKSQAIEILKAKPSNYINDGLLKAAVWPVYPEIGSRLGVAEPFVFKTSQLATPGSLPRLLDLEQFVSESYELYGKLDSALVECSRIFTAPYKELRRFVRRARAPAHKLEMPRLEVEPVVIPASRGAHPYRGLPTQQHWKKAVAGVEVDDFDPVSPPPFKITGSDLIASGGSCFAQHIARALQSNGYQYFIAEQPPEGMGANEATISNYGVFSARYGNIYTARQLDQLFDRAYGTVSPVDTAWQRADGAYADPFRPEIEPDGFASVDALVTSRTEHFAAVRHLFETTDVFIFTLGLTETWRSKIDGAVFPLAPGVTAGSMNEDRYEFLNQSASEVTSDMASFIKKLRSVNSTVKLILTVSPVPLVATFEPRHVLVSTTYSKSVLRVAADEITRTHQNVWYFPSYEIITGGYNRGLYFEDDLRSVTPAGVAHVMRCFLKHGVERAPVGESQSMATELDANARIVCEEERLGG